MQYYIFIIKSALEDFLRNKMRTFLTSLGILIGVASVVLLLAFGLGLKEYIRSQFNSLGTNLVFILPGKIFNSGGGFNNSGGASIGTISFDEKDLTKLKRIKEAEYVLPNYTKSITVEANGKSEPSTLYGVPEDIFPARNLEIETGRVFEKTDVDRRNKVIVAGPKIIDKLFSQRAEAIDAKIRINNMSFKIIGILKSKGGGGFGGPDFDSFIYMPYKTAYIFNTEKEFKTILLKAKTEDLVPALKQKAEEVLLKRYEEDDFSITEQTEILNTISSIFSVLNTFLLAIGAISLIVGGVGIMNIMYVSVTERTREVGIRRAIGATKRDVLLQFLTEAVLLSVFGGAAGLLLAYGVVLLIQDFFPAYIDFLSVVIAIGVSSAIGVSFGVFPAKKAAELSPMEAIRYE